MDAQPGAVPATVKLVALLTLLMAADSAVVHVAPKDSCLPLLTCPLLRPAVKVVTFLTMPIAADSDSAPTQALYMQQVKEAFLAQDAMTVIVGLVAEPLGRWDCKTNGLTDCLGVCAQAARGIRGQDICAGVRCSMIVWWHVF